jgi:hypothetical protein
MPQRRTLFLMRPRSWLASSAIQSRADAASGFELSSGSAVGAEDQAARELAPGEADHAHQGQIGVLPVGLDVRRLDRDVIRAEQREPGLEGQAREQQLDFSRGHGRRSLLVRTRHNLSVETSGVCRRALSVPKGTTRCGGEENRPTHGANAVQCPHRRTSGRKAFPEPMPRSSCPVFSAVLQRANRPMDPRNDAPTRGPA